MLKILSALFFALLLIGVLLSSTGFQNKPLVKITDKKISSENGYNLLSIKQLDSLSAMNNLDFSYLVR